MTRLDAAAALEELDRGECLRLIGTQGLGRVGLVVDGEPVVLPVSFLLVGETVVFRTARNSAFDVLVRGRSVVFEVDHADPAYHAGWSVVGRGQAVGMDERFVDGAAVDELSHLLSRPWGFDLPAGWVGIRFDELTGRRIVPLARTAGDWG